MVKNIVIFLILFVVASCNSQSGTKAITKENIQKGETLFRNVGCTTCHSVSGEVLYGPPLNTVYNSVVEVIHDGKKRSVKATREYIHQSIQNPDFEKVDGFQSKKMPKPTLSEEDMDYIIDYLESLNSK